jgi:hypothetical protein
LVPIRAGASLVSVVQPKIPRLNAKKRNAIGFIRNCSFHGKLSKNIVTEIAPWTGNQTFSICQVKPQIRKPKVRKGRTGFVVVRESLAYSICLPPSAADVLQKTNLDFREFPHGVSYFSADAIFNSASSARIHAALPIITSRERRPGAAFTQISASISVLNNLVWRTRAGPISSPMNCRVADRLTRFFPGATIFLLRIETTRRILHVDST